MTDKQAKELIQAVEKLNITLSRQLKDISQKLSHREGNIALHREAEQKGCGLNGSEETDVLEEKGQDKDSESEKD